MSADLERSLSDRAKSVAGAWFGMMSPGKGELTFQLRGARPSDEAQAGLDELVRAGVVSVEPFNKFGGIVYRPLIDFRWALRWLDRNMKNPAATILMTVAIDNEADGAAHQKAALAVAVEAA